METKEEVLKKCSVNGLIVKLPDEQLDRKLYMDVAKSLELIGGKWNRKVMGFSFQSDPTELLEQVSGGEKRNLKKEFQFFATPDALADRLVRLADLKMQDTVLEPEAGQGAIVKAIQRELPNKIVDCYELMPINQTILCKIKGVRFIKADFLEDDKLVEMGEWIGLEMYDKIVANPPFQKNLDIDHILAMYRRLKKGGRLVSVSSKHWKTSSNNKETKFRTWIDQVGAIVQEVDAGEFKDSGTMIETLIIIVDKK